MARLLDSNDMLFHILVAGGTGSGKTNAILYMLDLLFRKEDKGSVLPALFLFDPAGDASIDLLRAISPTERNRVVILDPQYVTFGFNLLSLPEGLDAVEKPEVLQIQVEEFSALLSDVFNTDATTAPRLMWIFKGALYYLYTFTNDPTFWDLYNIMLLFTKKKAREVEDLFRRRDMNVEIIEQTLEAISKLPQDAYMPVINRISNFVLPPSSITFRTFCSRKSTFDLEKLMSPGRLTIFRIPSSLPNEFRRLFSSAVVMQLYFASLKRAKRLERSGEQPTARIPVVLAADEFRDIGELKILRTILSQSRKYGLYLWMVVQTLSEIPEDLMGSIQANVGPILAFRGSPDDARKLGKLLLPQRAETVETLIPGLEDYAALVRKRPVGGRLVEPPFRVTFPKLRDPVNEYAGALSYMKGDMDRAYGGAVADRNLVYKKDQELVAKLRGDCPLEIPLYWVPLTYLHRNRGWNPFTPMAEEFESDHAWGPDVLKVALSRLVDMGKVQQKIDIWKFRAGTDAKTGKPIWKDPTTEDETLRAREAFYSISEDAQKEYFVFYNKSAKSDRAGGDVHVALIKLVLEEYWKEGAWCAVDRGDRAGPFPDVLVLHPKVTMAKAKDGRQRVTMSTEEWDEEKRMPVESQATPSKNPDGVMNDYERDMKGWGRMRFVTATRNDIETVKTILQGKELSMVQFVHKDVGLPQDELENLLAAEKQPVLQAGAAEGKGSLAGAEQALASVERKPDPSIHENELRLLSVLLSSGYKNRPTLASGLGVAPRQVTRYLVHLHKLGLLSRTGKRYLLMQEGRRLAERHDQGMPGGPAQLKLA
ncbi:MAG: ATP-binding protein [archaeon]|nr:MAG: ATP-binding protein [archaeon]